MHKDKKNKRKKNKTVEKHTLHHHKSSTCGLLAFSTSVLGRKTSMSAFHALGQRSLWRSDTRCCVKRSFQMRSPGTKTISFIPVLLITQHRTICGGFYHQAESSFYSIVTKWVAPLLFPLPAVNRGHLYQESLFSGQGNYIRSPKNNGITVFTILHGGSLYAFSHPPEQPFCAHLIFCSSAN